MVSLLKSKPMGIAIICLLVALLAVGAVLVYLQLRPTETVEPQIVVRQPRPPEERGIIVTPENVDEVMEMMERPPEISHFTANMNVEWYFERGDMPSSNVSVVNDTLNTTTMYFDLFLDETDELIFTSPFIPVGASLDELVLYRVLPAGNHPATVVYHMVDDDFNELATVSVAVLLRVLG